MKAMILAAGRGLRLRPLTDKKPKPLISVNNQPLIVHQVMKLANIGIKTIVVNVSYQAKQIIETLGDGKAYGVNIEYSFEPTALETGGGICQALTLLGRDPFMVISADIWTDFPLKKLLSHRLETGALAHLILVDNPRFHPQGDFHLTHTGLLDLNPSNKLTFANLGIYHPNLFQGKSGIFPLSSLLYQSIAEKKITGEYYKGLWFNIGTPTELEHLNDYLRQKK
ncbi:mannose-1-phosphate guanyltransferase [Rickettsiella grylli]|uniref:N-acetylmuramate alpha-1-phosphate uridylyltransferase MurU n=1 Tax=Rickettsiella grylli TaxID=59196 RepID=UPI0008FD8EA9|nr:nucleotidyltransferase family protein [Rickettsiella grylli]OJA01000.1 mannose-1-phosphate guanyltransferase [Rickettsiella grylli]